MSVTAWRAAVKGPIVFGLVTTIARTTWWVSPREPGYCTTRLGAGQHDRSAGSARLNRTTRIAHPFDIGKPRNRDAMVEMRGLEPLTPSLQRRCSPS